MRLRRGRVAAANAVEVVMILKTRDLVGQEQEEENQRREGRLGLGC